MPLYEYSCPHCSACFEQLVSSHDTKELDCPNCGKKAQRVVSSTSFQLKGEGWYVTEYGKNSASSTQKQSSSGKAGE